ncbi:YiaA/YiaB family inner membrane protein [Nocardioides salsibiostraticola]
MSNQSAPTKNTQAFFFQAVASFGIALLGLLWALLYMPMDAWQRGFLAMTCLFLVSSSFTLAKVIRDAQDDKYVVSRLDQARVDKILAEHDPFKAVS